jgi:purine-binding chemotaxis protein CheW
MSQVETISPASAANAKDNIFVTMRIDRQLFGIDVYNVRDVLRNQIITRVPLSPPEVAGSLNSRGRIVTVLDVRKRLNLPPLEKKLPNTTFVVVEVKGELHSLLVDDVGDVLTVSSNAIEKPPANLGGNWKSVASGIYKMDGELLVLIDIQSLLKVA